MSVRTSLLLAATLLAVATPAPAHAAPPDNKDAVLAAWTQPAAASFAKWHLAREHKAAWKKYRFDWSTDGCTGGPERPFGYDFRQACYRHDFGYRNYGEAGTFRRNKARLDYAFLADLGRVCKRQQPVRRPLCVVLARTYYSAAQRFGHM